MHLPKTVKELKEMLDHQRKEQTKSLKRLAETMPDLPATVKSLNVSKHQRPDGSYHLRTEKLIINQ